MADDGKSTASLPRDEFFEMPTSLWLDKGFSFDLHAGRLQAGTTLKFK